IFFFFQAEDGIRDGHVTGVQTCALPILAIDDDLEDAIAVEVRELHGHDAPGRREPLVVRPFGLERALDDTVEPDLLAVGHDQSRSEERRVGKECRSRWAAYQ